MDACSRFQVINCPGRTHCVITAQQHEGGAQGTPLMLLRSDQGLVPFTQTDGLELTVALPLTGASAELPWMLPPLVPPLAER